MCLRSHWHSGPPPHRDRLRSGLRRSLGVPACAVLFAMTTSGWAQTSTTPSNKPPKPLIIPEANPMPDANVRMQMQEKQQRKVNYNVANTERLKLLAVESNMLVTMAMALKAEVDSTKSDQLSAGAQHKAEVIEKLARDVKEKMKLTIAPN